MTTIEWVRSQDGSQGKTWSPVTGCTKISPGCKHCYAERMARRLAGRYGYPEAPNHFDVTLHPDRLDEPLRRGKPTTYFVCSMGDLFHEELEWADIAEVWAIMQAATHHTFQVLTKRPQRMLKFLMDYWLQSEYDLGSVLPNVLLGVSAEDQSAADERIPLLLATPAAVRFVSCEPLLGPIDLLDYDRADRVWDWRCESCGGEGVVREDEYECDWVNFGPNLIACPDCAAIERARKKAAIGLDWVIVGGESGPGARPMHPYWVRDIVAQCKSAGVPVFVKQMGNFVARSLRLQDRKGADPSEWPRDLRVREWPRGIVLRGRKERNGSVR